MGVEVAVDSCSDQPALAGMKAGAMMQRATVFMIADNVSRVAEPLLKMTCAVAFVGGAWGSFAYLESIVLVLMRLSLLGLEKGVIWLGGSVPDDREFVRQASGAFGFSFLVACAVAFGAMLSLSWLGDTTFFREAAHSGWFLAAVPFQALAMVVLQALVSRQHLGETILVRNILQPVVTFGLPLALVAALPRVHDVVLPVAYLVASVLASLVSIGAFFWAFRASFRHWSLLPWPGLSLLRYSLPVSVTDILQSIALRTDNTLLFQFGGTREVEVYSVAIMVSKAIQAIRESYDGTALSFFSRPDAEMLGSSKRQGARYVAWVVMGVQQPILWGLLLFGAHGLGLLDTSYAAGYATLICTSFLFSLSLPGILAGTALMGLGKTMLLPVTQIVFLGSFVALNTILIPLYGSLGAGLSLGLSTLVSGLLNYLLVHRVSGRWLLDWKSVLAPLSGGLLFFPILLLQNPRDSWEIAALVIWGTISLAWILHVLRGAKVLRDAMGN